MALEAADDPQAPVLLTAARIENCGDSFAKLVRLMTLCDIDADQVGTAEEAKELLLHAADVNTEILTLCRHRQQSPPHGVESRPSVTSFDSVDCSEPLDTEVSIPSDLRAGMYFQKVTSRGLEHRRFVRVGLSSHGDGLALLWAAKKRAITEGQVKTLPLCIVDKVMTCTIKERGVMFVDAKSRHYGFISKDIPTIKAWGKQLKEFVGEIKRLA
ncbi:uncharacterized protein LOC106154195 [Lingula anatina]|uniref:Uncharacterized protein LOC106154195 n=1 Tax=Lingula anatina TaxID=7574 RepID=A0A1S3HEI9_LINAN|nr:uncharacterized protein LOC106154195 [Lingula anatina]XP_013383921.1 uncharacterized protein LOC106154195 [Lingula anatina]|eukprot:XP_013383920.1 uncharacterized protein LOC106154195 [Lingula anatina]